MKQAETSIHCPCADDWQSRLEACMSQTGHFEHN